MFSRKICIGFLLFASIGSLFSPDIFALSNNLIGKETYPGKVDIKNVSGLGKNLSNDFFAGAMNFQYPFIFPEGSRGMNPELTLAYSSNNTDAFSPYGYGFSLSVPRIQRSAKKGVSELYLGNEYVFNGQDLVPEGTKLGQYRSKDMSDMSLYTQTSTGGWIVNMSDGKTRVFGRVDSSRIADLDDQTHVYAWLLDEEKDQFGNTIQYKYTVNAGQSYLTTIEYAWKSGDTNPLYRVNFDYINKGASLSSYRTQFEVSTKKLLSKITLSVSGVPTRGYSFQYDSPDTPISHLLSITEFASNGEKLPSISFGYGDGQYQHMITQVDNHRGGKAIFTYAPSTGYRTMGGALQNEKLPFIVQTLSKQVFTDSVTGVNSIETFEYGSGSYYYDSSDIWGREYVGFGHVTIFDTKSKKDLFFHQSQSSETNPLKYSDHIAKKGRQYLSDISDIVSGKLLSREITRYDMRMKGNRWLVFPSYKISSYFDDQKNHKDTAIGYEVDDMGNLLKENQYGWVNADINKGVFIDIPGDSVTMERSYVSNITKNLYSFPASEKIFGFSGELMSQTRTEYDLSQTGMTLGLPTAQIVTNTLDSTEIKDQIEYDTFGMPTKKTDAMGNITIFAYDPYNITPISTTNPLGWKTLFTYNYPSGKVSAITDQNQVTKTTDFDIWGREKQKSITTREKRIILTDTIYDDIRIPNTVSATSYFDENKGDQKMNRSFLDGWGRIVGNLGTTEKTGQYTMNHVRYDDDGNAIFASYPVFTTSPDWSSTFVIAGSTDGEKYRSKMPGASYLYDSLGRVISERTAHGITKKTYLPGEESLIDALGYTTKNTYNAKGNLIKVMENDGTKDIITSYTYDGLGRPISLIDALGNIRNWKYDGLGRLSEASDLHTPTDDLYGVRKYRYDPLGRMKEYENPAHQKSIYSYDAIGRVLTENIGTLPVRTYTYDTNTLGTLAKVTDSSSSVSYTYDTLSRKIGENRTIGNTSYTVSYGYNIADNLTSIIYPDNGKALYTYRNGFIEGVSYTTPSGILNTLITDISYNPNSTINDIFYGNGAVKHIERDTQYNYRLSRATTSLSGTTLLDTSYTYDGLSDITGIQENGVEPLRKTVNYTYDLLQRLTSANSTYAVGGYGRDQIKNISYTYDPIGNILSASQLGNYVYSGLGYANPHAVMSAGDTTYGYDALGNTVIRNSGSDVFSFAYSPYSEMLSSTKNGETTNYTYDHTRRRITKNSLGLLEHHIIDGYEVEYESGALIEIQSPPQAAKMQTDTSASGTTLQTKTTSGLTQTGEVLLTSSGTTTSSGSMQSFSGSIANTGSLSQTGSISTSSGGTMILPESQSGTTQTGTISTSSGDTNSTYSGTTVNTSSNTASGSNMSGSYMIIAGYVASNNSGSTSIDLTTTLTHIMLGDEKIATFQSQTDDTPKTNDDEKLVYHISDHLNSSSLDLSNTGIVLQATDYEPFGKSITYEVTSKRIKGKKGGYTNKYLFANKELDDETVLQYFEKRYYDNRIGKFTTEDPVFWEVGLTKRPSQYFSDPQGWNSYAYTENNPINLVDPSGEQDIGWWIQNTIASAYGGSIPTEVQNQIVQESNGYKQAGKEIGTFIMKNSPGTGDIGDVYNTIAGIDFYTGKKISSEDRIITGIAMVVPGVSGKEIKSIKESGTKVMSKSFYLTSIKGGRIDVENPQTRPGQIHLQIEGDRNKYYLNTLTNQFHIESTNGILAAKSIQNVLKKVDVQKAILKAKNVLGIN